jgi:hypothetical protein
MEHINLTYCDRDCAELTCGRNLVHVPDDKPIFTASFPNCDMFIEPEKGG